MAEKKPIVIDASIWIDFVLQDEIAAKVVEIVRNKYVPVQSEKTMKEVENVSAQARHNRILPLEDRRELVEAVRGLSDICEQTHYPTRSRDPDDNVYLGLAMQSGAEMVISKDADLLGIKYYQGIQICSPEGFLQLERERERSTG